MKRAKINFDRLDWVRAIYNQAVQGEISSAEAERRIRLVQTDSKRVDRSRLPGVLFEDDDLGYLHQLLTEKRATVSETLATEEAQAQAEGRRFLIARINYEGELDRISDLIEKIEQRQEHFCQECGATQPYTCKMDCGTQKFKLETHIGWGSQTLCKADVLDYPDNRVVPIAYRDDHDKATCPACKSGLEEFLRRAAEMSWPMPWEKAK